MKRPLRLLKTDDYVEYIDGFDYSVRDPKCVDMGGRHYCASELCMAGSGKDHVALFILCGPNGFVERMTPVGARELAAGLVRAAAKLEARLVASANAQLAAALAKKCPDQ